MTDGMRQCCIECGQKMRAYDDVSGWGRSRSCPDSSAHIIAKPEEYLVSVEGLGLADGSTYNGLFPADELSRADLLVALARRDRLWTLSDS